MTALFGFLVSGFCAVLNLFQFFVSLSLSPCVYVCVFVSFTFPRFFIFTILENSVPSSCFVFPMLPPPHHHPHPLLKPRSPPPVTSGLTTLDCITYVAIFSYQWETDLNFSAIDYGYFLSRGRVEGGGRGGTG